MCTLGKHGELKATESGAIPPQAYNDKYIHFSGETTTIAGRSVVIHNNGTRVACGNIYPFEQSSSPSSSTDGASSAPDGEVKSQHSGASGGQVVATMAMAVAGTVFGALMAF